LVGDMSALVPKNPNQKYFKICHSEPEGTEGEESARCNELSARQHLWNVHLVQFIKIPHFVSE